MGKRNDEAVPVGNLAPGESISDLEFLASGVCVYLTPADADRLGIRRVAAFAYYADRGIVVTWDYLDGRWGAEIWAAFPVRADDIHREAEVICADPEAYALQMVEAGVERDRALAEAAAA